MINSAAPQNILLLIPQLTFGGAERVFHDHGRELAARGHRVTECVFDSSTPVDFPTRNALVALDVPPAGSSPLSKLRTLQQRVRRLRQLKQELRIDVCISHLEGADYLNLLSKGREQVILCVHNSKRHDPGFRGMQGWVRRRLLMPSLYRRADYIVTVSRDLRQEVIEYLRLPASKVVTINNFVELERVRQRPRRRHQASSGRQTPERRAVHHRQDLGRRRRRTGIQAAHPQQGRERQDPRSPLMDGAGLPGLYRSCTASRRGRAHPTRFTTKHSPPLQRSTE
ncbi:MAG: hypothetical protein EOO60_02505 [Hymenobacter sp.]|nr:MAG: hypothetical protein EOO60_02505 [Hymenobacter sp.]